MENVINNIPDEVDSSNFKLTKLSISNFKNLKDFELNFAPNNLTMLIGNNGSGKSNILEAISAIFTEIYTLKRFKDFKYSIEYQYNNHDLKISKPYGYINYCVDNHCITKNQFIINDYMPSKVIAIYSGDETRMWEQYYERFYKQYLKDLINGQFGTSSKKLLYIDKSYWNIALLILILSNIKDHKNYVKNILHINSIDSIEFNFKPDKIETCINPVLSKFIKKVNKNNEKNINIDIKKIKRIIKNLSMSNSDFFEMLIYACMPRINKIITDIKINFNSGLTLKELSEGEKKRILLKTVMDLIANERAIVLLDEPDAHLHEVGKQDLYKSLQQYAEENNRSVIMTTHSPTLTLEANKNSVIMLDNQNGITQIIPNEKKEILQKLTNGTWSLNEQNIFFNSKTPLVLTEGIIDTCYIKKALQLFSGQYPNVDCLTFNGADNANDFLDSIIEIDKNKRKIIVLFDRDNKGKETLHKLLNIEIDLNNTNTYKKNNIYMLMLPKTSHHTINEFVIEDYFSKEVKLNCIKSEYENITGEFCNIPTNFQKTIKSKLRALTSNGTRSEFEGFKTLLDKLSKIIKDKEEITTIQ